MYKVLPTDAISRIEVLDLWIIWNAIVECIQNEALPQKMGKEFVIYGYHKKGNWNIFGTYMAWEISVTSTNCRKKKSRENDIGKWYAS